MAAAREDTRRDERALAGFVDARAQGDAALAAEHWGRLLTERFDQLRGLVYTRSSGHLSASEQEEAVGDVMLELATKGPGAFNGSTMGEFVNFAKQVIFHRCVDVQRRAAGRSGREERLDLQNADGETYCNPDLARALAAADAARAGDRDDAEDLADGRAFLAWGLPRLTDKRRAVLELTIQGLPCSVIQDRLGLSQAAVHQNRSRGLADLIELAKEWPGS